MSPSLPLCNRVTTPLPRACEGQEDSSRNHTECLQHQAAWPPAPHFLPQCLELRGWGPITSSLPVLGTILLLLQGQAPESLPTEPFKLACRIGMASVPSEASRPFLIPSSPTPGGSWKRGMGAPRSLPSPQHSSGQDQTWGSKRPQLPGDGICSRLLGDLHCEF